MHCSCTDHHHIFMEHNVCKKLQVKFCLHFTHMHPTTLKVLCVFWEKTKRKKKKKADEKAEMIANAYATNFKKIKQKHTDSIRQRNNCHWKKKSTTKLYKTNKKTPTFNTITVHSFTFKYLSWFLHPPPRDKNKQEKKNHLKYAYTYTHTEQWKINNWS